MKYIVRAFSQGYEPEEYDAPNIYAVVDQLLDEWVEGDADLPGVFGFLEEQGYGFGITDDEVDEDIDRDILEQAANTVSAILGIGDETSHDDDALALFISAISEEYHIEQAEDDELETESIDFDEEDYDY